MLQRIISGTKNNLFLVGGGERVDSAIGWRFYCSCFLRMLSMIMLENPTHKAAKTETMLSSSHYLRSATSYQRQDIYYNHAVVAKKNQDSACKSSITVWLVSHHLAFGAGARLQYGVVIIAELWLLKLQKGEGLVNKLV